MMKKFYTENKITIIVSSLTLLSFFLFPFYFYSESQLFLIPIAIFFIVSFVLINNKKQKLLWLLLFNPAVFLPIGYSCKAILNFTRGTPVKMKCCSYLRDSEIYSPEEKVFLEYMDDDCDWENLYYFTIDVNNYVTDVLLHSFGYPKYTYVGKLPDLKHLCSNINLQKNNNLKDYREEVLDELWQMNFHGYDDHIFEVYDYNESIGIFTLNNPKGNIQVTGVFLKDVRRAVQFCDCKRLK